ncbi:hypothetical protein Pmani_009679 [Petrolisthes manimaculis]|uniref:ENTH domain-containing protein n=1 Tax=Petrolisthes manimaculis TaxID=1843537 RepID=A0AAE1UDF1_9EUCA|nr:hypothetical protein Pmani_009679 [Petrolisthes manimaculis]
MELLKEAKNVVDFATNYPVLHKATVDNDTPTPGYLYEEIIKLSHHSPGHRQLLLDFFLARLQSASWPGKQKVVRILSQVCARGHRGVRVLLRSRDGELRQVAATGGPPDPLLANTPQLFLNSAIQELLTQLFDPKTMKEDEEWLSGQAPCEREGSDPLMGQGGYGGGAGGGRYQGFGSTPNIQPESLVTQVRGFVERVISPPSDGRRLATDLLGGNDKGDYQPLSLPSLNPSLPSPTLPQVSMQPHIPIISASQRSRYKAHKKGKAGGGWASDEEDEDELPPLSPPSPQPPYHDFPLSTSKEESCSEQKGVELRWGPEEEFLITRIDSKSSWPMAHDALVTLCRDCSALNIERLLRMVGDRLLGLLESEEGTQLHSGFEATLGNVSVHNQELGMPNVSVQDNSLPKDMNARPFTAPAMTASASLILSDTSSTLEASLTYPTTSSTPVTTIHSPAICTAPDFKQASHSSSSLDNLTPPMTSGPQATSLHHPCTSSPTTPSLNSVKLLVLLLLVEFGLHYEVFSPALINTTLGVVLAKVHREGAESVVKTKARKLSLIVAKLV